MHTGRCCADLANMNGQFQETSSSYSLENDAHSFVVHFDISNVNFLCNTVVVGDFVKKDESTKLIMLNEVKNQDIQ